jgi:hypothetical protein
MRSAESIKAAIGIEDLRVEEDGSGNYYWARISRREGGHHYSRSMRVQKTVSDERLEEIRQAFDKWWNDELN